MDNTWKVYGRDTFAREDYLVGEFPSEADAQAALEKIAERLARTQDEPLRDEVWIEPPGRPTRRD